MPDVGTSQRPLRVAIVGSGPSGFYAFDRLYKKGPQSVAVDLFEKLPTPFGLVRGGVAPDHAKIKKVQMAFEKSATKHPHFRFFGNVEIGKDLSVDELREHYDAVLFAHGADSDRHLNIIGEGLAGSQTATAFVGWYNGHPDFRDCVFNLDTDTVVVVGQGNVAIDVARILAKTKDELAQTDIAAHALEALLKSKVRNIILLGRRGPVQAKFTPPELKELGELHDCNVALEPAALKLNAASQAELDHVDSKHQRDILATLEAMVQSQASREHPAASQVLRSKTLQIRFLQSPKEIIGDGHVEAMQVEHNQLKGEAFAQWPEGNGEEERIPCGLILRSVGYRGRALAGLPFDEKRGTVPQKDGRILGDDGVLSGLYVAGWIKRGPSGVIGTNKPDANASVDALLEDFATGRLQCSSYDESTVVALLKERAVQSVSWEDWKRIDAAEMARGKAVGKPREKFTRIDEMLKAATATS